MVQRLIQVALKHKTSKGGIGYLEGRLRDAFKGTGQPEISALIQADRDKGVLYIPEGVSLLDVNRALEKVNEKVNIPCDVSYIESAGIKLTTESQTVFPADYGSLKGRVKELSEQASSEQAKREYAESELKEKSARAQGQITALHARLKDLEGRCAGMANVRGSLPVMMVTANHSWKTFVKFYEDSLTAASGIYAIPRDELETATLDYKGEGKTSELVAIANDLTNAEAARREARENPFINLNPKAEIIIERARVLREREKAALDLRNDLTKYVSDESKITMPVALTVSGNDKLLIMPFEFKNGGDYHRLEMPLVAGVRQVLDEVKVSYKQENFNGLLAFRISGMGIRARNKLSNALYSTEDPFVNLGGNREVLGIETFHK